MKESPNGRNTGLLQPISDAKLSKGLKQNSKEEHAEQDYEQELDPRDVLEFAGRERIANEELEVRASTFSARFLD